jgi:hypothetical protein
MKQKDRQKLLADKSRKTVIIKAIGDGEITKTEVKVCVGAYSIVLSGQSSLTYF